MKINVMPQGSGAPTGGPDTNGRISPERIAAAKAVAAGQERPVTQKDIHNDPQVARIETKRLKMQTNMSPDRLPMPPESELSVAPPEAVPASSDVDEQAATEETKPLSPQFAALARQRRALQVKERELADREKALSDSSSQAPSADLMGRLKSDPLSVLQEAGVTYDQLTEAILSGQNSPEIVALKAELKALKEGVDSKLTERDSRLEQQALVVIERKISSLISEGDTYEAIRETGSQDQVKELIHRTWKETGEEMEAEEACNLVEAELIEESLKLAKLKKIQEKLAPATPPQQQQPRTLKTLTSRDNASPVVDRRARALAAFYGK